MGSVRRLSPSASLLVAVAAVVFLLLGSGPASASPMRPAASATPVQMSYACTSKITGLMRYVSSPAQCTRTENAVTIVPGPVYVCIYFNLAVRQVAAPSDCPSSSFLKVLTLPPASGPAYFCAANVIGLLTYTTDPSKCASFQFPVVVPVPAPVLANVETSTLQYYAGTPAVRVTSTLTASSTETTTLAGATVTIHSGLVSGDDSLGFASQNGITGSYNAGTGALTLTGTASVADYQAALRSVTYRDSNGLTASGTRTISFQVNDGLASANLSNVVSRTIAVSTNSPPTAGSVAAATDKNTAIDINVLSSASDPDGDTLSVASVDTTGTKGSVSVNASGTIHYNPSGQFQGLLQGQTAADTFTYKVSDGFQTSASATVTVTINGLNDPPVLAGIESGALQYYAGTAAVPVTSGLTVTSPDTATLAGATVTIGSGLAASEDSLGFAGQNGITGSYNAGTGVLTLTGTASVADYQAALRSVTYGDSNGKTPSTGSRTISFQVNDGLASANLSNVVSRTISVNPNSPPTAGSVTAATDKNTAIDINVLSAASDPDGDTVTLTSVGTAGTKGSVSVNASGTVHYDPNGQFQSLTSGQTATDSFSYTVSDGFSAATGTVTVTINGVNDAPVISGVETSPLGYRAQDPAVQITGTLTISDDDDATMAGATVSITSGFGAGEDTLGFTNASGITGSYNAGTGVLTLTGSASLADYQAALQSVTFFTSDSSTSPAARVISFAVTDSVGAASTTPAQRTIDVSEAAQPPTAVNHGYTAVGNTPLAVGTSVTGPAAAVSGSLLNGDSDQDPAATLSVTGNTTPAHGTVSVNKDGTFTYTPDAGFSGTDTFQYTIAGSNAPGKTATATVTISVGTLVWYVDDSQSAAGNGEAGSPFSTLAAANSAAGANSIIFLYQGSATYAGGVTLHAGEDLLGQPHGLTVGGYALVAAGGSAPAITNSGGDGIDLAESADVEAVSVSSPSGNGIAASGVSDATVGGSTAVAVSGAGGDGIHISGGSGSLNFAQVSVTGSAGHSVSVASRTGGTVSFGGTVTDHGTGISLSGNTGATIAFGGTLTVSTGASTAFSATGGGTISASGAGSTLTTTTGTALTVQNTTIGATGLAFQAISSDGASPGISLASTGTSGGLLVSGTGSAGSGGTIQKSAGAGIQLSSTSFVSLTDMVIAGNAGDGISGSQVTGFTLAGSTVSGNGTQASVSGENNDGLDFSPNGTGSPNGLTGTVSITSSTITGSADNNAIISDSSGTLSLTVTGSTFSSDNATTGNDGLHVDANGSTAATVSVTGSTFTNNFGDAFQFESDSVATGSSSVTFSGNTLSSTVSGVLGGGVVISPGGSSRTSVTVDGNNIQGAADNGIGIDTDGSATLSGTVNGDTVGTPTTAGSGSSQANDIGIFAEGTATETLAITSNKLYQYANTSGIYALDREGSPAMNLTITGNTIADPAQTALWGVEVQAGATSGPPADGGKVCAAISGNSMTGSAPPPASGGISDFELDQQFGTTIELPGYAGGSGDTNAVVGFVQGNNNASGTPTGTATVSGSGGGFTGGSGCPAP
jgi:VCBS repeat-containing protein